MDTVKEDKRLKKGEQMRHSILLAAIDIISSEGIGQVSAAKIAAAIGTSKSNIFHHFKTKEAILLGVHDFIYEGFEMSFSVDKTDLKTYLTKLGDALLGSQEDMRIYKAFYAFYNEGLFVEIFRKRLEESTALLLQMIEHQLTSICADQGLVNSQIKERIKIVALGILCFLDGGGLHHMLNPSLTRLDEVWNMQIEFWENYLKSK